MAIPERGAAVSDLASHQLGIRQGLAYRARYGAAERADLTVVGGVEAPLADRRAASRGSGRGRRRVNHRSSRHGRRCGERGGSDWLRGDGGDGYGWRDHRRARVVLRGVRPVRSRTREARGREDERRGNEDASASSASYGGTVGHDGSLRMTRLAAGAAAAVRSEEAATVVPPELRARWRRIHGRSSRRTARVPTSEGRSRTHRARHPRPAASHSGGALSSRARCRREKLDRIERRAPGRSRCAPQRACRASRMSRAAPTRARSGIPRALASTAGIVRRALRRRAMVAEAPTRTSHPRDRALRRTARVEVSAARLAAATPTRWCLRRPPTRREGLHRARRRPFV